ncbi:TonB-dependent receptor [Prolixibacteraceae bacterium Z1-6]|uniref:TonB-dependent receptor n=1 Tax=Draconibacterium aestuarii TaxID=2998507 RepID=A0A9X3F879_9BACT|nr:TonB-dependent receptor [Prolixibacteraceae bacterium Z1-6]
MQLNNVALKQVFHEIEKSSEFIIVYSDDIVNANQKVDVEVDNVGVENVLEQALEETNLTYKISDRQIAITKKMGSVLINIDQQKKTINGLVNDSNGEPLPGVTIVVKGTTIGTVTNFDGNFTLEIPADAEILSFSFVGFQTQEISIGTQTLFNITLIEDVLQLDEVIAVGYGVQRKIDQTGATNRLTEENMNKSIATSPVEMMQGRVSGVNITQNSGEPGSGMTVRIRGNNSIRSGQEPLYVVDGIPLDNADITPNGGTAAGINEAGNKNPIAFLNPEDIESIDILKDASSTAIYGARGANGVVLITTKKGKKGEGTLSYDGYTGISQIREKMDILSAEQFRSYRKADGGSLLDKGASNDWQDEIYQNGILQSHNLSFGGGTDKFTYQTSVGYLDQEGIVETTGIEKFNGRVKVSQEAFDGKLNIGASLIASHVTDTRAPISETGGFEGDLILTSLKLNPTYPIYNTDGSYYQHDKDQRNPVAMLDLVDDETQTDRILANMSAEFEIIKDLKYKMNLGFDRTVAERRVNQDKELIYLSNKGEADINNITANNKLIENYFTYLKDFDEHKFNFLAGHAYQYIKVTTSETNVNGFEVDDIKYTDNLQYGNFSSATVNSSAYERELQSFFGRINYNYRDKYLVTVNARADGSSKFGKNSKYGFFPSAAIAWRASEEDFFQGMDNLSNLKVRLGWGLTGNQEIPDKISLLSVGTEPSANGYFNGTLSPGITFLRTPNPDVQWETTMQTNFGIDFGFWENRLTGTLDLFNKTTEDVLLEVPAKAPAATQTQWQNVPDLKIVNNGIEIGLNGLLVDKKDFTWDMGVNFAYISNEVKDLPVKLIETGNASGQGLSGTRVQIITNGQPIGTFYGMVYEGLDSDGMAVYKKDAEGNEVKEYLGTALPDFTYSLSTSINWKRFDFRMFWYGSSGNKVYNNTANALFLKGPLDKGNNVTVAVLNSNESPENSNAFSSRFIENASFLRLSNITVGYTLDTKNIEWLGKARLYVTGNNLLVFTDYTGFDPEVSVDASENGVPSMGIDYTSYPKPRTFTLGVNIQF